VETTLIESVFTWFFVYLLMALICTNVNEWIAGIFRTRETTLKGAIVQLLNQQPETQDSRILDWFVQQFYAHPIITGMSGPRKTELPAYLSARTFSTVVMDIAIQQKPGIITFTDIEAGINNLPAGDVKTALLAVIRISNNNPLQAQKNIEAWFNDTMDRVSSWYKRAAQMRTVIIATFLVLGANVDMLQITRLLWVAPTLRAELLEQAKSRAAQAPAQVGDNNPSAANMPVTQDELDVLGSPLGWSHQPPASKGQWADHILGWMLSLVLICLLAPLWFELLKKFMRISPATDAPEETTPSAA